MKNEPIHQSNELWQKAKHFNVLVYMFLNTDANCIYSNQMVSLGTSLLAVTARLVEANSQLKIQIELNNAKRIISEIEACLLISQELKKIHNSAFSILFDRLHVFKESFKLRSNDFDDIAEII